MYGCHTSAAPRENAKKPFLMTVPLHQACTCTGKPRSTPLALESMANQRMEGMAGLLIQAIACGDKHAKPLSRSMQDVREFRPARITTRSQQSERALEGACRTCAEADIHTTALIHSG